MFQVRNYELVPFFFVSEIQKALPPIYRCERLRMGEVVPKADSVKLQHFLSSCRGVLGGREAFESPAHLSLLRALSPQQNFKNRKPGRIKASQRMFQVHRKKGRFTIGSIGWHSNLFIF